VYETILVPTDGSEGAEGAAGHALALASAFGSRVVALSVVDDRAFSARLADIDPAVGETRDALARGAREAAEAVATLAGDDRSVRTAVETGTPHETIVDYADRIDADLVVMGTHGRTGLDRLLLGSVAERVIRTSDVPVLAARAAPADDAGYGAVLIPTDGSEAARAAIDHGIAVAERYDATVHALSVVDVGALAGASGIGMSVPDVVDDLQADAEAAVEPVVNRCDRAGLDVRTRVERGTPHRSIREYVDAEGIDLVTMGTHGRTGFDRFVLGSVTDRVLRTCSAPVLTVR
jgi:nucleotide-binding universal stress UspA family protein